MARFLSQEPGHSTIVATVCYNNHMRKSVADKKARAQRAAAEAHERHQRIALWMGVLLFASVCLLALSFDNWQVNRQIASDNKAIADSKVQIAKYKALAKINAAKKAERDAIAKIAAETAADNTTEQEIVAATPINLADAATCGVKDPTAITVIINKQHCFSPLSWAPTDLTAISGHQMRTIAAQHMADMINAATADNAGFSLTSGYRSYTDQQSVYQQWVQVNGSTAEADTVSARPGYSEHQTGLAADLETPGCALECFATSKAYDWLSQHAAEYGFIRRYPDGLSAITGYAPEPWHWRYVGTTIAKDMRAKGLQTLEEYMSLTTASS